MSALSIQQPRSPALEAYDRYSNIPFIVITTLFEVNAQATLSPAPAVIFPGYQRALAAL
jgi:hypothetical protein